MDQTSHARLKICKKDPRAAAQDPGRMQTPTWPGSASPATPAVYFSPAWNPRGGGQGCKENARRGMTDGRGEAAQGLI